MGFFGSVGNWFKQAGNTISNAACRAWNSGTVQNVINTVHDDGKGIINFIGGQIDKVTSLPSTIINRGQDTVNNVIDKGSEVINNAVDRGSETVQSLGEDAKDALGSLSTPLLVGGAVVLLILLKK